MEFPLHNWSVVHLVASFCHVVYRNIHVVHTAVLRDLGQT